MTSEYAMKYILILFCFYLTTDGFFYTRFYFDQPVLGYKYKLDFWTSFIGDPTSSHCIVHLEIRVF